MPGRIRDFSYTAGEAASLALVLSDVSTGSLRYWNTALNAFEEPDDANVADYDYPFTNAYRDRYVWEIPASWPAGGGYKGCLYIKAGSTLAASDLDPGAAREMSVDWNGEAETTLNDVATLAGNAFTGTQVANTQIADVVSRFAGITSMAGWLRAAIRSDAPDSTTAEEIGGSYDATVQSQQAIATRALTQVQVAEAAWSDDYAPTRNVSNPAVERTVVIEKKVVTITEGA